MDMLLSAKDLKTEEYVQQRPQDTGTQSKKPPREIRMVLKRLEAYSRPSRAAVLESRGNGSTPEPTSIRQRNLAWSTLSTSVSTTGSKVQQRACLRYTISPEVDPSSLGSLVKTDEAKAAEQTWG